MVEDNEFWEVTISKRKFKQLSKDPSFALILTLARIVNVLRFCHTVSIEIPDTNKPSDSRQLINSFLLASGTLYEGLKVANTLGKYFRELKCFKEGFAVLLKDDRTKHLQGTTLDTIRNTIVSHFSEEIMASTSPTLKLKKYNFASGYGPTNGQAYYGLADEVVVNYLIGDRGSNEKEEKVFKSIIAETTSVMLDFIEAADNLIAEIVTESGWQLKRRTSNKK